MGNEDNNSNSNNSNNNKNHNAEWKVLSDEPSLSSAALATTFHLVGHSFPPEFTHQCLSGECYRGYRPLLWDDTTTTTINNPPHHHHWRTRRRGSSSRHSTATTLTDPSSSPTPPTKTQHNNHHHHPNCHNNSHKVLWHESHRHHHDPSTQPLHVQIQLAPSGERCWVEFHRTISSSSSLKSSLSASLIHKNNKEEEEEDNEECPTASKKRRITNNDSNTTTTTTPSPTPTIPTTTTTTTTIPMSEEEILAAIGKALPTIISITPSTTTTTTTTTTTCHEDYLTQPLGKILKEYVCRRHCRRHEETEIDDEKKEVEDSFVITVADGPSVVDYHSQVQKLALWFIENADDVDVSDHHSGFWKVLYLFQKHTTTTTTRTTPTSMGYSLAGYLTLFHFHAPFHKPTPGIIARICQALVLPPFQGQGHGRQMMECVYNLAHGVYDNDDDDDKDDNGNNIHPPHEENNKRIVQVNVEDPSPGFVALRNAMDFQWLTRQDHRSWWPTEPTRGLRVTASSTAEGSATTVVFVATPEEAVVAPLSENVVRHVADKAKILPRQVRLIYEWMVFQALRRMDAAAHVVNDHDDDRKDRRRRRQEEWETQFRLMVKSRLNREHREDMIDHPSKDAKKAYLNQLYLDEIHQYPAWLTSSSPP